MAIGAILAGIVKQLLIKEAAKQAEKTGASPGLVKAFAQQIGKGAEGEAEGGDAEGNGAGEGVEAPAEAATKDAPEVEFTDRTFEEQLAFQPPQAAQVSIETRAPIVQPQAQTPSLPPNFRQMTVPGPGGRPITGMGEGTQPTRTLPQQDILQGDRPPVPPGIFAGVRQGVLNQPTTREQIRTTREAQGLPFQGRQTAFDVGTTIGDFLRSQALQLSTTDPKSTTVPVISPQTGELLFQKQREAVFQPRPKTEAEALKIIRENIRSQLQGEDEFAADRAQLKEGEVLIKRVVEDGTIDIMAVKEEEVRKTDIRL